MSIPPTEFFNRLIQVGFTDLAACQQLSAQIQADVGTDTSAIAQRLIQQGTLTAYQAGLLLSDSPMSLRVGDFISRNDQPTQPLDYWLPSQSCVTAETPQPRHGFLMRVPLQSLNENLRGWIAAHSQIHAPSLQGFELSGGAQSADQTVMIFTPLPDGASLFNVLQNKPQLSARKTVRIGVDIATALHAMHHDGTVAIPHGAVSADHVWVNAKGHGCLLRDPSSPARSPLADWSTSWITRMEHPALHAAPELANAAHQPTPKSDIYSLSCLLFQIYIGRAPFSGNDVAALMRSHAETAPPEIEQAINAGAQGNPILRVLACAMSKDAAARFESAEAFSVALQRAGELVAQSPQSAPATAPTRPAATASPAANQAATASPAAPTQTPTPPAPATPTQSAAASQTVATPSPAPPSETPPSETSPSPPAAKQTAAAKQTVAAPAQTTPAPAPRSTASQTAAPQATAKTLAASQPAPAAPASTAATATPTPPAAPPVAPASAAPSDEDDEPQRPRRRRRKRSNRVPLLIGMLAVPMVLLTVAVILNGVGQKTVEAPKPTLGDLNRVPPVTRKPENTPKTNPVNASVNGFQVTESDRLLWVPPYPADTKPSSLALLPPGPAMIITVPLSDWVQSPAASPLRTTFAPELDRWVQMVEKRAGVQASEIKRCTAAFYKGPKTGWPEVALAIELTGPKDAKTLFETWKTQEVMFEGVTMHVGAGERADGYFVGGGEKGKPPADGVSAFAIAPGKQIEEVAKNEGGAIPLARSLQSLWDSSSQEANLVALVTPNFLFADGREMLANSVPEFVPILKGWLIPDVAAASISIHTQSDTVYVELREAASGTSTPASLLESLRNQITTWPDWGNQFIVSAVPDASWRLLASKLPGMLQFVGDHTRSTIINQQVVASFYLPSDAGAQVALGTFLAMNTPAGSVAAAQPAAPQKALTVDEMLNRPMSIAFVQLSLQFAIDAVGEEFASGLPDGNKMPNMKIIGGDLQLNGITQNQQIRDFEENNVPLRDVLTKIVRGANPDKTATGPDDPKQALLWVVNPVGKPPAETEILITTRDAAQKKGYVLPKEFQLKE